MRSRHPVEQHPSPDRLGRRLCSGCRDGFTAHQTSDGRWIHAWCLPPWNGNIRRYFDDIAQRKPRTRYPIRTERHAA